jgi:hypothetical protein
MRLLHTMIVMFLASFVTQYFLMGSVMTNSLADVTNSIGKVYISVIMALYMVAIEVMMHDHQYSVLSTRTYVGVFGFLALFVFLYRKQIGVGDKQYLEEMIEHHSMALLTSNRILEKTSDYNVAKLAKNILQKQQDEILEMRSVLHKLANARS